MKTSKHYVSSILAFAFFSGISFGFDFPWFKTSSASNEGKIAELQTKLEERKKQIDDCKDKLEKSDKKNAELQNTLEQEKINSVRLENEIKAKDDLLAGNKTELSTL